MNNIKIGITGLPGAGKTHALIKVIEMLETEGVKVGGMITEPIVEDSRRTGFYVMDWRTKQKSVLAHTDIQSKFMVGKFGVDLTILETVGVGALMKACEESDVIVIDEVGKMEVESEKFVSAVKAALDVEKPMLLTLHKKSRNPLLQDIRRRDDVRILEVTPINRNLLPYKIMKLMKGELL
ncbi:MAG TPA: NTPase [Methanomassiliicoccales archaeon]|nr:NTPase [Methanomassiliicoccales archaeon]HXZ23319.1 NTPase [Methanomassiliicoccales archaeon]